MHQEDGRRHVSLKHAITMFALECCLESGRTSRHNKWINTHKTSPTYKVDSTPFPSSPLSRASPRQAVPFNPELECHDHIAPVHLLHGATVVSPLHSTHRNFTESRFSRARSTGFSSPACLQPLTCMCPWYILLCLLQVPLQADRLGVRWDGGTSPLHSTKRKEKKKKPNPEGANFCKRFSFSWKLLYCCQ